MDKTLGNELHNDGPPAWEILQRDGMQLEGIANYTIGPNLPDQEVHESGGPKRETWSFKRNNTNIVFEHRLRQSDAAEVPRLAGAQNSDYAFSLDAAPPDSSTRWVIKRLGQKRPSTPTRFAETIGFLRYLQSPYCIYDIRLVDLINDKDFKILSISRHPDSEGRENLIKIEFSYPFYIDPERKVRADSAIGWILLNPQRFWSVEASQVDVDCHMGGKRRKLTGACTVEYFKDRRTLPSKVTYITTSPDKPEWKGERITVAFVSLVNRVVPENEFTLSAFNLPEINPKAFVPGMKYSSVKPSGMSLARILWLIATIVFIIALVMLRFARKKRVRIKR